MAAAGAQVGGRTRGKCRGPGGRQTQVSTRNPSRRHRDSGLWPQNRKKMNSCSFKAVRFVVTSYNHPRK